MNDNVNHPGHYTENAAGIEVIEVTGLLGFCNGNAFKYLARYKSKKDPSEDVAKAIWYLNRWSYDLNKMATSIVATEEERGNLIKNIQKFIDAEKVPEIRRAFETIKQQVLAEIDDTDFESLPLLRVEEYKTTTYLLTAYAESINGKKPEDFNG